MKTWYVPPRPVADEAERVFVPKPVRNLFNRGLFEILRQGVSPAPGVVPGGRSRPCM